MLERFRGLSAALLAPLVRLLLRLGVISKTTRQGREAALYRVEEDRWPELVRHRMEQVTALEELTEAGLRMFSGQGERARRLRTVHEFYRWPEILRMTTDAVGAQRLLDIGAQSRTQIGTKVNCVHD